MSDSTEITIPSRSKPSPEGIGFEEQCRMAADPMVFPDFIPSLPVGKIPPNNWCRGWNSKRNKYCQHHAGHNTDHKGLGRCNIHGGSSPSMSGIYSTVTEGKLAKHLERVTHMEHAVRLDLGPELNMLRALTMDFIDNYKELVDALLAWNDAEALDAQIAKRKPRPQRIPSIHEASELLIKISNIAEKAHRQLHRDSIPKNEFFRLQAAMGNVVRKRIMAFCQIHEIPEEKAEKLALNITDEWLELEL